MLSRPTATIELSPVKCSSKSIIEKSQNKMLRILKDDGCTKRSPTSNRLICLQIVSGFLTEKNLGKGNIVMTAAERERV